MSYVIGKPAFPIQIFSNWGTVEWEIFLYRTLFFWYLWGSFPYLLPLAKAVFMVVFRWIWRRQAPEKCWEIWPKGKQVRILYNWYMISNHWLLSEKIKCIILLNIYKLYEKSTSRSWSLKTELFVTWCVFPIIFINLQILGAFSVEQREGGISNCPCSNDSFFGVLYSGWLHNNWVK